MQGALPLPAASSQHKQHFQNRKGLVRWTGAWVYALCATGLEHILPPRAVWLPRLDVLTGTLTHPVGRQQAALRIADAYRTATGWKMNNELHLLPATMAAGA